MDENQKLYYVKVDHDGLSCIKIFTNVTLQFDAYKKEHFTYMKNWESILLFAM